MREEENLPAHIVGTGAFWRTDQLGQGYWITLPDNQQVAVKFDQDTNHWYYLWFINGNTYTSDKALISHNFEQVLGLGHLGPGEVLSNSSGTSSTDEPQYHKPEPEPPAPTLLGIKGQPIDPNEPDPPLVLAPPNTPIEQPPASIHLAIMAQVGPQAPVAFTGIPQQQQPAQPLLKQPRRPLQLL